MQRPTIVVMSAVSVAVVGLALRTSTQGEAAALPVAVSGVLTPAPAPAGPVPLPLPTPAPAGRPAVPAPVHLPHTVTVNGKPAAMEYGPVQVQITLTDGRITAATAIAFPRYDLRERQINDPAIPQLNQEALQQQSAAIDTISGASETSVGYQQSLQSALDAAHAS